MDNKKYINDVLKHIHVDRKTKKRIKEDLTYRIEDAMSEDPYFDAVTEMGRPKDLAAEFTENLENGTLMDSLIFVQKEPYEYKSEKTFMGLPLIHIHTGGTNRTSRAKGIIAIGDFATGIISIGGVSVGVVSLGGVSLGVISLGGVALGAIALGGVAIGGIALGGVAVGIAKALGGLIHLIK